MKRLQKITAAADDGNSKLADMLGQLEDDFDFIISGLEKLDRTSAEASNEGLIIAESLQSGLEEITDRIAEKISE